MEYIPISNASFSFSAKPIILLETNQFAEFEPQDNGGNICKQNIHKEMIPPALSKVR